MCIINVLQSVLFVILQIKLLAIVHCYTLNTANHLYQLQSTYQQYAQYRTDTHDTVDSSVHVNMLNDYTDGGDEDRLTVPAAAALLSSVNSASTSHPHESSVNCTESDGEPVDLPVPSDISVMLASWTPPSIRVSWTFPNLTETDAAAKDADVSKIKFKSASAFHAPMSDASMRTSADSVSSSPRQLQRRTSSIPLHTATATLSNNRSPEGSSSSTSLTEKMMLSPAVSSSSLIDRQQLNCSHGETGNERSTNCTSMMNTPANKVKCNTNSSINSPLKLEAFRIIYHPIKTR